LKRLCLLGATGSIGNQTLDIVRENPSEFQIVVLTANRRIENLINLIHEFKPEFVSVGSFEDSQKLKSLFSQVEVGFGDEGLKTAATWNRNDSAMLVVNALVGIVGLVPTIEAIRLGRDVALANKETLVVGGEIINEMIKQHQTKLLPIDSEHSAIWQCLNGEEPKKIKRLIITASGGTFRDYLRSHLMNVTVEDALKHPNWSMGNKITIDSATMMNKGFEVIEAHHLFGVDIDHIETVIHRESIIHSMVEFIDHSMIAQLSDHDMRLPISYALFFPSRCVNPVKSIDLVKLGKLSFEALSFERYPCLNFAYQALKKGGNAPAILNAANEAAVDLFLNHKITFLQIETIIYEAMNQSHHIQKPNLEDLLMTDRSVKKDIYQRYT